MPPPALRSRVSKLRHLTRCWLDPNFRATRKRDIRKENVQKDKVELERAGIRHERRKRVEDSLLLEASRQELLSWHHEDQGDRPTELLGTHAEPIEEKKEKKAEVPRVVIADDDESEEKKSDRVQEVFSEEEVKKEKKETMEVKKDEIRRMSAEPDPSFLRKMAPPIPVPTVVRPEERPIELLTPLVCYICKAEVHRVHFFYDQMCLACGNLNWEKRIQSADLSGKVALVTGGRIKIGYLVALKLLRAGALVIVTTRFANDATIRFVRFRFDFWKNIEGNEAREPDFTQWKDRLHVYSLEMRLLGKVEAFAKHVASNYPRLDYLINNAAQTVRRPPVFYEHLIAVERAPLPRAIASVQMPFETPQALTGPVAGSASSPNLLQGGSPQGESALIEEERALNLGALAALPHDPPALTQVPLIPSDYDRDEQHFPPGMIDQDGQQVDSRIVNSWVLRLGDVSTVEAAEVHVVNALAPFVLCTELKPLLMKSAPSHVVNVSSMEGKFSRTKKATHPHTNMAKAALNMMTRTSGDDWAKLGVFMNSIDTGWITYENPTELTARKQELGLEPPIDEEDGAARILDPIFTSVRTGQNAYGMFYKDYLPSKW